MIKSRVFYHWRHAYYEFILQAILTHNGLLDGEIDEFSLIKTRKQYTIFTNDRGPYWTLFSTFLIEIKIHEIQMTF